MSSSEIIQQSQEIKQASVVIDPRSFHKKLWDALEAPWIPLAWAAFSVLIILVWPGFIAFGLLIQLILWRAVVGKPDVLPIHLPISANKEDKNDPKPGDKNGYYKARGSFYIGRLRGSGIELWASFKALTQHFLIFGTTGAGKTESIVSYIVQYLLVGSGVAFQDAKAAPKAMIQMATFCRIFGRDDDFRVTNYITGMNTTKRDPAERSSNDAAVFARGSPESNTQLLVALMPPSEGENKIFSERAIALVAAVMPALNDLRDFGKLQIDPAVIRKYMGFKHFAELYRVDGISKRSRDALQAYLLSLAGYDETKEIGEQNDEVTRQFGFAQAYFTRSLASLSDTYGHIYLVGKGEIDYQDAVLNGRILMTLLPSMEKSGEELSNLGKIVLTATRNGMVVGLGTVFEGSAEDIVHNLPTNSDIPYGIMNDENAYMLVEGQEMINAQARGLGFGVMTGTQDVAGMLEKISRTTKQIMANSAFKQIMYLDDKETTELAVEFSGEAQVMVRGRYEMSGDLGSFYATKEGTVERRARVNATAIKKQGLGQAYLMYQGKVHETQVFNHGIQEKGSDPLRRYVDHWYSVRMAKISVPTEKVMMQLMRVAPRPEWQDLALMINDTSRAMLKEMTVYFSSMITINRLARSLGKDPDMLPIVYETAGALNMLETVYEPAVGLLKEIVDHAPTHISDTANLFAHLLANHKSEQVAVIRMADEAGLDAFMGDLPFSDEPETSEGGSGTGSSGSGGGGLAPKTHEVDPLDGYLAASGINDFEDNAEAQDTDANDATTITDTLPSFAERPMTALGSAVERNLVNMPWMASAVDYHKLESSLVQTELYFTDDQAQAQVNIAAGLRTLSEQLTYPQTKMPDKPLSLDDVRALMTPFIRSNG